MYIEWKFSIADEPASCGQSFDGIGSEMAEKVCVEKNST